MKKWLSHSLIFFSLLLTFCVNAANKINGVRIWPSPDKTRVVFDLSNKPSVEHFFLTNPNRLVLDFKDTGKGLDLTSVAAKGKLVKKIRYSTPKIKNSRRVVIELAQPLNANIFALAPTQPYGDRLVVDLEGKQTVNQPVKTATNTTNRDLIIAIDAGHGGEDPGSIGAKGNYEKKVTLQISKRLKALIDKQKGMKAVMIRTGDYYVGLNKRSELARKSKADLLVSIHADAFTTPQPRGASVWMLSMRRANSEIGRWLEQKEKHSELLGGAAEVISDTANEKYLAKALLDMSMEHSIATSYEISNKIIGELKRVTKMHKKAPQAASLAVLKSPDIPSILVETGFISNPTEERLLNQRDHQQKLANALFKAVNNYFRANPPDGTLYASLYNEREYIVRRGDSLSVLAARYDVSINALKKANRLRTNTLRIGQKLKIPQS
ncbi:N-acetylmuramoyl-L-alanine amidase [Saccharobesus litoralis]|uniref:N-acetylmuramoyl-L-alanine amidase AmiC n=1 Tax=Saccharobesus litoralis TaxID=2172099 RepID=A0A2S0VWF4_9ALTE|nr:N-acetylmuramoyl-L-alanine amidase [Saccharobesus litoralis]AWB68502.1 N-acetylmuramoyl-L-alanine amidase [Saccharobesus litoralis]